MKLIFPNPKTSGNARYTYLAAWGAADNADGGDKAKTEQFMTQFLKNVEVFDTGGRGATTTFAERGLGDVLISFESEVNNIRKQYEAQGFEVVIPKTNILAEFPVAWVDKNVQANGTEKAAKAYLNWLYSPQAQTIITHYYYRVNNPEIMGKQADKFPQTELFRVEDKFGTWPEVMKTHFASGGDWTNCWRRGVSNACRFFPTRAARLYVKPRHQFAVCLPDPTVAVERAGDAAHR